jgi:hypothetical protein
MCPQEVQLGWPPAPHWATISCVALSTSASTSASDQLCFVRDAHTIYSTTHDTTTSYVSSRGPIWAGRQHHIGPPYHVYRSSHPLHPVLVTIYALVEIIAKRNQPVHTICPNTYGTTTSYVSSRGPICAGRRHHIGPPYHV